MANNGFWDQKPKFWAPKKTHFCTLTMFWPRPEKVVQRKKVPLPKWPKNNVNKVPRWVFRYVGNKTFDFSSKKKDFLPKNDQIWPKIGIFGHFGSGHAGLFSALLMGRLLVVAHGLYLVRHLFTLFVGVVLFAKHFKKSSKMYLFLHSYALLHQDYFFAH